MRGALCVCSLVNQMLELLDRIRIGRFTSSGKEMAHAHRLLRKRDYSILLLEECCINKHTIKHYKTKKTRGFVVLHEQHCLHAHGERHDCIAIYGVFGIYK